MQTQLSQRAIEVKIGRQAEAVNGASALLAEKDLVGICLEDFVLVVARLYDQRHHRLVELARQRTLGREDEILDQLLGQGAATLDRLAGLF